MKWRVRGDWKAGYSTIERALRRARELAKIAKVDQTVLEVDDEANETPVAVVRYKKR